MRAPLLLHRAASAFVGGDTIWERDADIYCVLDGCRADSLALEVDGAGSYRSIASTSKTWIRRTFDEAPDNVAYVTGNPFSGQAAGNVELLHEIGVTETGGVQTADPAEVASAAASVWRDRERLGVEKVVAHFMQPHVPFRSRPEWFSGLEDEWGSRLWREVGSGFNRLEWFQAYHDNLRWVLEDGVGALEEQADAVLGLTADHGNAAGEWGIWGHPKHAVSPSVRRVPWVALEADMATDPGPYDPSSSSSDVGDRLGALGYSKE